MNRHPSEIGLSLDAMPLHLLREGDAAPSDAEGDTTVDLEQKRDEGRESLKILCNSCRHELTTAKARTTVDGAHRHVKVNPHGHVFHIACFHPLPGVTPVGTPSTEFSWFAAHRWQIALCARCHVHLGWVFSGSSDFGALIEGRFIEEDESER